MKPRFIFSLCSMVLAAALVVGGFSLAWFTDEAKSSDTPAMHTGTVGVEITKAVVNPAGAEEWERGQPRDFAWTLQNKGTKAAYLRARVNEKMEVAGPGDGNESAWGEGTRFSDKNWSMYFQYKNNPTVVRLLAGQHHDAGRVTVWLSNGDAYVTIKTNGQWGITEAHVHLANSKKGFPDGGDNPPPGQFKYKKEKLGGVNEVTFEVDIPQGTPVYVAAHVKLRGKGEPVSEESQVEWEQTVDASANWIYKDGWWYYCGSPVQRGEKVNLQLTGMLPCEGEVLSGEYTVYLEAEAVQASNNAIDNVWRNHPCGDR